MIGINDGGEGIVYGGYETAAKDRFRIIRLARILISNFREKFPAQTAPGGGPANVQKIGREISEFLHPDLTASVMSFDPQAFLEEIIENRSISADEVSLYIEAGDFFERKTLFTEALKIYKEGIKRNPDNPELKARAGFLLSFYLGRKDEAIKMYESAYNLGKRDASFLLDTASVYMSLQKFREAEELLDYVQATASRSPWLPFRMAELYIATECYSLAEDILLELQERYYMDTSRDFEPLVYARLGELYMRTGETEKAAETLEQTRALHPETDSITVENYAAIINTATENGIILIMVQYPMRQAPLLKEIAGRRTGVLVVDNGKSFKEAVEMEGYWSYFVDIFAGDFGHMSVKGKQLISENITDVIAADIFNESN